MTDNTFAEWLSDLPLGGLRGFRVSDIVKAHGDGYHGKMSIDFEFSLGFRYRRDKDLTPTPKPGLFLHLFELLVSINMKSEFSSLRLFLKESNTEDLITWTNHLFDRLVNTADWNHFIQPIEHSVEQTYSSIPLFESNDA